MGKWCKTPSPEPNLLAYNSDLTTVLQQDKARLEELKNEAPNPRRLDSDKAKSPDAEKKSHDRVHTGPRTRYAVRHEYKDIPFHDQFDQKLVQKSLLERQPPRNLGNDASPAPTGTSRVAIDIAT